MNSRCHVWPRSDPPHLDLLVLGPAAIAVRLQGDWSWSRELQPVELQYRVAVAPDDNRVVLHSKLEQPPLLRLDPRIARALDRVQRSGGVMRALDVMELHLVAAAGHAPSGTTERHSPV